MIHLRSLGEEERALERFRSSWKVNPHRSDTGREYAAQCLRLGLTEEGIAISRDLHRRFPTDPTLEANLAVALLLGGDLTEAESVAVSAESRAPTDQVTRPGRGWSVWPPRSWSVWPPRPWSVWLPSRGHLARPLTLVRGNQIIIERTRAAARACDRPSA